jgi:GGDEF domain-containing protein
MHGGFVREMDIFSLGPIGFEEKPAKGASVPADVIEHLQILIRGIALHAIEGDPEDLKSLRKRMSDIAASLSGESSPDDLLVGIGQTLRVLEEYNRNTAVSVKGQVEELRGMLSTMTATVMFITSFSETGVKQLGAIETKLQRASSLEDTRQVKAYMSDCLALVRTEALRVQNEARTKINSLKNDVARLSSRIKAASADDSQDPVTGLPGRFAGEEAIIAKISSGKESLVALFVLDRMVSINGRFGRLVGDDILISSGQMLVRKLPGATLYRWTGPAFIAIFDPSVTMGQAELRSQQAGALRLEKNIEADDRSVLIVVTATCHLERISAKSAPDAIFKSLDSFTAATGALSSQM